MYLYPCTLDDNKVLVASPWGISRSHIRESFSRSFTRTRARGNKKDHAEDEDFVRVIYAHARETGNASSVGVSDTHNTRTRQGLRVFDGHIRARTCESSLSVRSQFGFRRSYTRTHARQNQGITARLEQPREIVHLLKFAPNLRPDK